MYSRSVKCSDVMAASCSINRVLSDHIQTIEVTISGLEC